MLVIVVQVVARYVFGQGSIMMEELQWHLYAIGFMLGLSFTEVQERNVRIDVLAEKFSHARGCGSSCSASAGAAAALHAGGGVVLDALLLVVLGQLGEVSAAPGGLPYRWVLKSFIVTAFALLALVAWVV
jgi:TRAP-type mannitol/chloroaromatic compound transport system permease small subunit